MDELKGIERIDSQARRNQHLLNEALWKKLQEEGFCEGHAGRISGFFCSNEIEQAGFIIKEYNDESGWETDVLTSDDDPKYYAQVTCPLSRLSIELLNDLSDMYMISALDAASVFEGLEVDVNTVVSLKKPWWKIW